MKYVYPAIFHPEENEKVGDREISRSLSLEIIELKANTEKAHHTAPKKER